MDQIGTLASAMLAGRKFQPMLVSWNTQAGITWESGLNTCSGATIASMRPIVRAMRIDAAEIGRMKTSAPGLAGSILGDFPRFCSRTVRAGSMKDTIQITDPVSRLNAALAEADRLSGYCLDTSDPWELVGWLLQHDRLGLAIELQSAARAAQCWEETSVDS